MHFITGYFFLGTLTFLKKLQLFPGIVFGILSFSANAQEAMNIRLLGEWTSSSVSVNPQGSSAIFGLLTLMVKIMLPYAVQMVSILLK